MSDEKDPRIEAVAKLLWTGPIYHYSLDQWEDDNFWERDRAECLMAAEDVLRGIDEAAGITTEERLARLPVGAVIRDGIGTLERMDHPEFMWRMMGGSDCAPHSGVALPAQILWEPRT